MSSYPTQHTIALIAFLSWYEVQHPNPYHMDVIFWAPASSISLPIDPRNISTYFNSCIAYNVLTDSYYKIFVATLVICERINLFFWGRGTIDMEISLSLCHAGFRIQIRSSRKSGIRPSRNLSTT